MASLYFAFPSIPLPIGFLLGIICGWLIAWAISKHRQKQVDNALLGKQDVTHSIGSLINALDFYWDKNAQKVAKASLIHLLPRVQADDARSLSDYQRNRLRQALIECDNVKLIVAILEAFRRWGDGRDLACVEQFSNSRKQLVTNKVVQVALHSTLSELRERMEQECQTRLLLRPMNHYDDPANTLVRPADGTSEAPTHLLLRPSEPGEDEKSSKS
jgi:hypothetical protein